MRSLTNQSILTSSRCHDAQAPASLSDEMLHVKSYSHCCEGSVQMRKPRTSDTSASSPEAPLRAALGAKAAQSARRRFARERLAEQLMPIYRLLCAEAA